MSLSPSFYVDVALAVPLRQCFTYLIKDGIAPLIGVRVRVPLGRRHLVGVIVAIGKAKPTEFACKEVKAVLDIKPIMSPALLKLLKWASHYYQHPIGEVIQSALPKKLREGGTLSLVAIRAYALTNEAAPPRLVGAPVQQKLLDIIAHEGVLLESSLKTKLSRYQAPLKALIKKGWVAVHHVEAAPNARDLEKDLKNIRLNEEQKAAVAGINKQVDAFKCSLLHGITGSGKTEVYFALIQSALDRRQQSLVLFPEIALTTQLEQRFINRFGSNNIVSLHSGLSDAARGQSWLRAGIGQVPIILGTRLAVFAAVENLGLIIVDEEHDSSFKQQEGFRYHARSVAVKRANDLQIPIVLGSATPSLESLFNVELGKYQAFRLTKRAATANLPQIELVDLNHHPSNEGLTQPALRALAKNHADGKQSMVFINRRGFAPVLYCSACQWVARCQRCDAPLTQHRHKSNHLSCHYCGANGSVPEFCLACRQPHLSALGEGTQRLEQTLAASLPSAKITRFDRDEMSSQSALEAGLQAVHNNETDILVGTQLLTKGHDFSNVSLVVVVHADQGLHSHDFRATEHLAAQLIQVAGRAGRSSTGGHVIIQTRYVKNPMLLAVQQHDYRRFAHDALAERKAAGLPPYGYLAIWRAQSPQPGKALNMLQQLAIIGKHSQPPNSYLFDPCKSAMEKKAGRYRAQLLVGSTSRKNLGAWLQQWLAAFDKSKLSRLARWSLDVDPIDLH